MIKVRSQVLVGGTTEHNHRQEQSTTESQKLRAAIRGRAAMTEDPEQRIIADTLVTCTQGIYYMHICIYTERH